MGTFLIIGLVLLRQVFAMRETVTYAKELHIVQEELRANNQALSEANTRLRALATTDPLTGLPNHRAFVTTFDQELKRTQRYYRSCALLFLDLDHFKALNDGYGHPAGDAVLQEFSTLVGTLLRGMDTLGRWGGEEFVALLPETDIEGALAAAERIRTAVAAQIFSIGGGVRLTCSIGIAAYPFDSEERDGLIRAADQAMYAAKKLGRNQVRTAKDPAVIALAIEPGEAGSREEAALAGTVEALATLVEARDHYTGQHTRQVARLTLQLALALGLDASEAYMIGMAGRLHDVGKVAVPDAVLQKPGRLTEKEWEGGHTQASGGRSGRGEPRALAAHTCTSNPRPSRTMGWTGLSRQAGRGGHPLGSTHRRSRGCLPCHDDEPALSTSTRCCIGTS